jgi:hypothetical protein
MNSQFSNSDCRQQLVRVEFIAVRWQESSGSLNLYGDTICGFDLYSTDNIVLVCLCGVYRHIYLCPFIGSLNICTGYRGSCPG